jgi:DNA helicase-2/ATP-dependent DNA helicase PcrA
MVDVLELPGAADEGPAEDERLPELQANFLASEWADRAPSAIEVAIETPIAGTVVRGRIDAVFPAPDSSGRAWDVVDWKTGAEPHGPAATARAVQLAAYRLAWARLMEVPVEQVGAAFFYAATGRTVRPVDLLDEAALTALVTGDGAAQ